MPVRLEGAILRAACLVLAAVAAIVVAGLPASAAEQVTVGTDAEAWFLRPAGCLLVATCGSAERTLETTAFPADTLHVGMAAGQEESRTFLRLDLAPLADAQVIGAELLLPVAEEAAGTRSPENAAVRVCLAVPGPEDETDASAAPQADCETSTLAIWRAAEEQFSVNLTSFLDPWRVANTGLLLLPDEGSGPTSSWHVALSGRDRSAEGARPITAVLTLASPPSYDEAAERPDVAFVTPSAQAVRPAAPGPAPADPPGTPAVAVVETPGAPLSATSLPHGFSQPAVLLLPIAFLTAAGYLAWALPQPARRSRAW